MLSHAKVSKFDFTTRAHKYVCTFDISAKTKKYKVIIACCPDYVLSIQIYTTNTTCGQCSSHVGRKDQQEFVQCTCESQVP